jgi:hypothetical protein
MTFRNGDGPDGALATIETGGIVDFGNINAPPIAENSSRPQAADGAIRRPQGHQDRQAAGALQGAQEGAAGLESGCGCSRPAVDRFGWAER